MRRDYISFLEFVVERINLIVESGGANFTSFIDEMDGEQTSLTALIMPFFNIRLVSHANSDRPSTVSDESQAGLLILIRRKAFNRIYGDISTDISNARK